MAFISKNRVLNMIKYILNMEDLHTKYLKNSLTQEELCRLREEINCLSDEEIGHRMEQEWLSNEMEVDEVPVVKLREIGERITVKLKPQSKMSFVLSLLRIAAVLLIPLLVLSMFYFYRHSFVAASHDMIISVGKGERVSIVLPDGSKVRINALSMLRYNPVTFNKESRQIKFEGEAFFEVAHNEELPFLISTEDMDLEVLGTVFNLKARTYEDDIEVLLLEGHVLLESCSSHNKLELFENQCARLCKETGMFTVMDELEKMEIPWLSEKLVFRNRPLKEVIRAVETNFDVTFHFVGCDTIGKDCFTGTLPARDLGEILEILHKSYGFKYEKKGQVIFVSAPASS